MSYDDTDIKDAYSHGYWHGVLIASASVFTLCLLVGLYSAGYLW